MVYLLAPSSEIGEEMLVVQNTTLQALQPRKPAGTAWPCCLVCQQGLFSKNSFANVKEELAP